MRDSGTVSIPEYLLHIPPYVPAPRQGPEKLCVVADGFEIKTSSDLESPEIDVCLSCLSKFPVVDSYTHKSLHYLQLARPNVNYGCFMCGIPLAKTRPFYKCRSCRATERRNVKRTGSILSDWEDITICIRYKSEKRE